MSSQRSDWRERLHANPSRMEQELAIKLQDNRIDYLTQVEIPLMKDFLGLVGDPELCHPVKPASAILVLC